MRTLRGVLAVVAVAAGMVVGSPGAAHACSCVGASAEQLVQHADAVVWARVDEVQMPVSGMGEAHYLLAVERVYKGEVTEHARVDSEASGASCGLEGIRAGRRMTFFLDGEGSPYDAGLCGGTGTPRAQVERAVGALQGDAVEPLAVGVEPEPGGPTELPMTAYSYAGIGAGALASVVVAAALWRRRRSGAA